MEMKYKRKTKPALWVTTSLLRWEKPKAKAARQWLRKRSKTMTVKMITYCKRKNLFLEDKRCAVFSHRKATEIHHKRGRAGKLLLDERYWIPVSRAGHNFIHKEPKWARELGLLCRVGEWGKQ